MSAATLEPAGSAAAPAWWPGARQHLRWRLRRMRATLADLLGVGFTYPHPIAGRFVYHPGDYLSRRLYLYGFEEDELRFAVECARQGGVVLDVGANIGIFTAACAHVIGDGGRVVALEPGPAFAKLKVTCARLRLANVEPIAAAAGRTRGTARLVAAASGRDVHHHLERSGDATGCAGITVEIVALDDLPGIDATAVTLLKIDVEGAELGVVEGASRLLRNRRVALIVEFYPAGLEAAGTSAEALWRRLTVTHVCVGVRAEDGSIRPPALESAASPGVGGTVNTLWLPAPAA